MYTASLYRPLVSMLRQKAQLTEALVLYKYTIADSLINNGKQPSVEETGLKNIIYIYMHILEYKVK